MLQYTLNHLYTGKKRIVYNSLMALNFDQDIFIVKNLLTDSEREELKAAIDESRRPEGGNVSEFKFWSRINSNIKIPDSTMNKFHAIALEHGDPSLNFSAQTCFRYDPKYASVGGLTQCPPHNDGGYKVQFSIDYQVESNVSWPLWVEGKEYILEDNDALVFSGRSHVHWRDDQVLNDGEFVDMYIMHFTQPGYEELDKAGKIKHFPKESIDNAWSMYKPLKPYECKSTDQYDHSMCDHG
jgi:hypothetical protein